MSNGVCKSHCKILQRPKELSATEEGKRSRRKAQQRKKGCATMTSSTPVVPTRLFNTFAVELPDKLDFRWPEQWKRWYTRWGRYHVISGLLKQDQATQINTMMFAMSEGTKDDLMWLRIMPEEACNYDKLVKVFKEQFAPRRNMIYECARLNWRCHAEHETVDEFITDLNKLAEPCKFEVLKDGLLRDRLTVVLRDKDLNERLQLDAKLTLKSAKN